jgi:hypothetical protein
LVGLEIVIFYGAESRLRQIDSLLLILTFLQLSVAHIIQDLTHAISPIICFSWLLVFLISYVEARSFYLANAITQPDILVCLILLIIIILQFGTLPTTPYYTPLAGETDESSHDTDSKPMPPMSMFSYITFSFMTTMMKTGRQREIGQSDLW